MHLIFNRKIYFTDFSIINGPLVIDSGKNPLYDFPKMGESKTVENFSENSSILVTATVSDSEVRAYHPKSIHTRSMLRPGETKCFIQERQENGGKLSRARLVSKFPVLP